MKRSGSELSPPAKLAKTDEEYDLFSNESLQMIKKEALWRQLKECRQALTREVARGSSLSSQRDSLSFALDFVLRAISGKDDEMHAKIVKSFEDMHSEKTNDHESLQVLKSFIQSLGKDQSIDKQNELVDSSRLAAISKSLQELQAFVSSLKDEIALRERKILRLEMELSKTQTLKAITEDPAGTSSTSVEKTATEPSSEQSVHLKAQSAELEELRKLEQKRSHELSALEQEYARCRARCDVLESRLRQYPASLERDPHYYDQLQSSYSVLRDENAARISASEALGRDFGVRLSSRSERIEHLEAEFIKRRLAAKEFAEAQIEEVDRMRKDRDQMREYYESTNMQVAALQRQNAQLQDLNMQLSSKLELTDEKMRKIIQESQDAGSAEAAIMAEIEVIGEAFDSLQKQNTALLQQLSEREQIITKVTAERLKSEFALTQVQREADLVKQKALKIEMDALKAAEHAETDSRRLRIANEQLERTTAEQLVELESLRWRLSETARQLSELRSAYESLSSRANDTYISERLQTLDRQIAENKRLEEKLQITSAKLDAYVTSFDATSTKDVQEELAIYKVIIMFIVSAYTLETDEVQFLPRKAEECRVDKVLPCLLQGVY